MEKTSTAQLTEHQRFKKRVLNIFDQRKQSLVEDGYHTRFLHKGSELMMCRLKHMANGNEIILKAYPLTGVITQYTNHILTHYEQVHI